MVRIARTTAFARTGKYSNLIHGQRSIIHKQFINQSIQETPFPFRCAEKNRPSTRRIRQRGNIQTSCKLSIHVQQALCSVVNDRDVGPLSCPQET